MDEAIQRAGIISVHHVQSRFQGVLGQLMLGPFHPVGDLLESAPDFRPDFQAEWFDWIHRCRNLLTAEEGGRTSGLLWARSQTRARAAEGQDDFFLPLPPFAPGIVKQPCFDQPWG